MGWRKKGEKEGGGLGSRRVQEQGKEKETRTEKEQNRRTETGGRDSDLSWGGGCARKPHHLSHICGDAAGKCEDLALQVNQESV